MAKESVTASGESIEEAIQAGLGELSVAREDVKIEIVDAGKGGVLGIGKKPAVVKLIRLSKDESAPESAESAKKETKKPTKKAKSKTEKPKSEKPKSDTQPKAEAKTKERKGKMPPIGDGKQESIKSEKSESKPKAKPVKRKPASKKDEYEPPNAEELAEESAVASEMMAELFDLMGIDVDVSAEMTDKDDLGIQIPVVSIVGEGLDPLIGHRGNVLNDLQFVARSMVSQRLSRRTSFVLDIDGYRQKRMETLVDLARKTAEKAVKSRRPMALNPMPPHERRIIHMTLRDDERVDTQSKGEGNRRRIRVIPKRSGNQKSKHR